MIELTKENWFDEVSRNGIVVVDFYANWCQPCQQMMKVFPRLETNVQGKATLTKLNIEEQKEIMNMYNVTGIPTFIFFKNGQEVTRLTGVKTMRELELQIVKLL